ncbi:MAG: preprotein translocase subunit YajC [Planctomycetota bacterium]
MVSKLVWWCMLAADAPAAPAPTSAPGGTSQQGGLMSMLPLFVIIFVLMYLFIFAPQRKKEKKRRQMLDALGKGEKVVTIGGIHGTIWQVKPDEIVLDVGNDQKMTFSRGAIARVDKGEGDESRK